MNENLYHILTSGFPKDRTKPCLILDDASSLSFGEIEDRAGRMANAIQSLGVKAGDRVAVQIDKSPDALCLFLGVLKAGAVFLPLNTAYQKTELEHFITDAEPSLFVCRCASEMSIRALSAAANVPHILTLDADGSGSFAFLTEQQSPQGPQHLAQKDDLAALLYTSGTTGRSKGAMLSHGNLSSNILTLQKIWKFQPDDILLHALPIFHTHGLFVAAGTCLLNGTPMIFLPSFDADQVIRHLPNATLFMGVPTFYTRLLDHPDFTRDLTKHIRVFISGSAPLLAETHRAFEDRTGHIILERYGMTESSMNSSNPYDGKRRAGTVGFPLPDVEIRVASDNGGTLRAEEIGMIEVRGPNLFQGYWRQPERTKEEFRPDGFFITGDIGKIDHEGYIHIVGRAKDLIISGGFNIYPKEIESVIDSISGVLESAVVGVPHPDYGESVVAVIRRHPDSEKNGLNEEQIIAAVKEELAAFKAPRAVFFLEDFPRNAMGKIQKNILRQKYADCFSSAA